MVAWQSMYDPTTTGPWCMNPGSSHSKSAVWLYSLPSLSICKCTHCLETTWYGQAPCWQALATYLGTWLYEAIMNSRVSFSLARWWMNTLNARCRTARRQKRILLLHYAARTIAYSEDADQPNQRRYDLGTDSMLFPCQCVISRLQDTSQEHKVSFLSLRYAPC